MLKRVYLLEDLRLRSFLSGNSAMSKAIALCLFEHVPLWFKSMLFLYTLFIGLEESIWVRIFLLMSGLAGL